MFRTIHAIASGLSRTLAPHQRVTKQRALTSPGGRAPPDRVALFVYASQERFPVPGVSSPARFGSQTGHDEALTGWRRGSVLPERRRKQPQHISGWPRWGTVGRFREAAQSTLLFPLIRSGYTLEVRGRENLRGVKQPCLIVSNHNMHLDWSMVLRALPRSFRRRTMVAAAATDIFGNRWRAFTGKLLGNAFAFEKGGSGVRESLEQTQALLDSGWNVLIFPEGKLTVCGPLQPFKSGIGWIAARSEAEIVPMRVDVLRPGLFEGARFPRFRGRARVSIGKPLVIERGAAHDDSARRLEQAVRDA